MLRLSGRYIHRKSRHNHSFLLYRRLLRNVIGGKKSKKTPLTQMIRMNINSPYSRTGVMVSFSFLFINKNLLSDTLFSGFLPLHILKEKRRNEKMWISTNETASSKIPGTSTKTPRSNFHTPHFSDEDTHPAPQPATKQQTSGNAPKTEFHNTPSSKKSIKTYTAPSQHFVSASRKQKSSLPTPQNPPAQRHIKIGLCALLYAAGTFASGFLFNALSQQERELLRYFSQQQLSIGSAQPFARFLALFMPAVLQLALILIFSFCAIGAPLIGTLITLSGVASGASTMIWISEYGASGIPLYIASIGLYLAILTTIICFLGRHGINLSSGLYSATFTPASHPSDHTTEPQKHSIDRFLRYTLGAVISLVSLCGIMAAASDLYQHIVNSLV